MCSSMSRPAIDGCEPGTTYSFADGCHAPRLPPRRTGSARSARRDVQQRERVVADEGGAERLAGGQQARPERVRRVARGRARGSAAGSREGSPRRSRSPGVARRSRRSPARPAGRRRRAAARRAGRRCRRSPATRRCRGAAGRCGHVRVPIAGPDASAACGPTSSVRRASRRRYQTLRRRRPVPSASGGSPRRATSARSSSSRSPRSSSTP